MNGIADAGIDSHDPGILSASTRGLIWREWIASRNTVLGFVSAYLVLGWVLQIFFHPGFMLAYGVILAAATGAMIGGGDAAEGSEEFAFSLPPTRQERYVARLAFGGAIVGGLVVAGVLSIALDLPQIVWSLFASSGFTEPFPAGEPRFIYGLAVAIPLATYAVTFAIATVASARSTINASWILGLMCAGAATGTGFLLEWGLWTEYNGYMATPLLATVTALAAVTGFLLYTKKEGISRPAPMARTSTVLVVSVALAVIIFFMALLSLRVSRPISSNRSRSGPKSRAVSSAETPGADDNE